MAIDVAQWLHALGLGQYAATFARNDVDGSILLELKAEDLVSLGVSSVGHRRRLLSAIAALRDGRRAVVSNARDVGSAGEAERRQLNVMFCDLVGSTPLSVRFDPEDLSEVIGAYHRTVAETVARFAGSVARYMGDGVLVLFGHPQAHEDDAERAVRAALAVVDAIVGLRTRAQLHVRLGIASGLVVVGDLIGQGAARKRDVIGETPNLAARLQALAPPGTVSSLIARGGRSAPCSKSKIWDRNLLPALLSHNAPGGCWAKAASSVGSRPCAPGRRRWSAGTRRLMCCLVAGSRPRVARVRSSWFPASPALASRG